MARRMSRQARKETALVAASELIDKMEDWYDEHEDATFVEIETKMGELRREMMGEIMAVMINGRDTGLQSEAPCCQKCANPLRNKGYRKRVVHSMEGNVALERSYYVCVKCEAQTLFPPGSEA